jgi:anthranilate synthase component 1
MTLPTTAPTAGARAVRAPVVREVLADLETPVSAYLKLSQGEPVSFLLESVEGGERWARYSFIGVGVRGRLEGRGGRVRLEGSFGNEEVETNDPLRVLYERTVGPVQPDPRLPAFFGGAVGYSSYDLVRSYERLPDLKPDELDIPDLLFVEPEGLVVFDHLKHKLFVVSTAYVGDEASRERADKTVERLAARLRGPLPGVPGDRPARTAEFNSNFTREGFEAAVERTLEYIRAGDAFQVVIAQRFSATLHAHPFAVYRALRTVNPSPYMGYLHLGDLTLVAASPESLCRSDGKSVVTRPIAGTRPRGATPEEDRALEEELKADAKERAEHIMLVDLGRNDLGKVSRYGSVRVEELFTVERYSHVMHLVSSVRGDLPPDKTPLDALASTLPMGTVSGAPKIRAMEIIEELEPTRRGWYGGAFGYIAHDSSMDMALTLRTALVKDGRIHIQAGGGIVADSVPSAEYDESVNKSKALMRAVQLAEAGL